MGETPHRLAPLLIPVGLVGAHATLAALFAPFGIPASEYPAIGAYLAIGAIGMQPVLFAMWAALGPESLFQRFAWAAAACALVAYAQSIPSFRLVGRSTANTSAFDTLLFTLVVFGIAALIFFIVRQMSSWRIRQPENEGAHEAGESQFSLKYLLGWVTASAVLLAVGRVLTDAGTTAQQPSTSQSVAQIFVFVGIFCVVLFPTVGIPWLVLAYRGRSRLVIVGALIAWGAMTWAAVSVLEAVTPTSPRNAVSAIVFIQLGAGMAGFISAFLLRVAGFDLAHHPISRGGTDVEMPSSLPCP